MKEVKQSDSEAFRMYEKAARQGVAKAQCNIGNMYNYGRGVKQSYTSSGSRKRLIKRYAQAQYNSRVSCIRMVVKVWSKTTLRLFVGARKRPVRGMPRPIVAGSMKAEELSSATRSSLFDGLMRLPSKDIPQPRSYSIPFQPNQVLWLRNKMRCQHRNIFVCFFSRVTAMNEE